MKKTFFVLMLCLLVAGYAYAAETSEDAGAAAADAASTTMDTAAEVAAPAATEPEAPAMAQEAPAMATAGTVDSAESLEFVSGEVSSLDEANKTVTVKLYGETDNAAKDKTLTVTVDQATDITDGEKDRDLKSLTAGTEVDVEYEAATKKATYIFVY